MKYWMGILLFGLHISVSAQEYRDVKSWLDDMDINSALEQPNNMREFNTHDILQPIMPSLTLRKTDNSIFKTNALDFKLSNNFINRNHWKPTNKLLIEGSRLNYKNIMFSPKNLTGIDLKTEYKLTNKLSFNLYGYYIANDYKNPTLIYSALYRSEIGASLSYNITKNVKIKTGMQYQYNVLTRRWGYMYLTGIAFSF